tara:strand:+ start:4861 stop:5523 length:663 start_codon:yes stop_codon:yes gene_type:complete
MGSNFNFLLLLGLLLYSCTDTVKDSSSKFEDIDILNNVNIAISKGEQKVVDAVAKHLFKDPTHIYLKADYIEKKSLKLRNQLSSVVENNPSYSIQIRNLADSLHSNKGNIKAEFYKEDINVISSILYSDSAKISNRYNNMIAEGNVVIYSPTTNLMLLGSKVLWDNRAKRILSEENVTIVKITDQDRSPCIQKSVGFESDMDLSNYIFYNITGQIAEDCF